jgi:hypothetical protein
MYVLWSGCGSWFLVLAFPLLCRIIYYYYLLLIIEVEVVLTLCTYVVIVIEFFPEDAL